MLKHFDIDEAMAFFQRQEDLDVMDQSMLNCLTYLNSHDLHGHAMPEYGRIELKFGLSGCPFTMKIEFDARRETGTASIVMPMNCVRDKRAVMCELFHRINYITVLGEWIIDPNDGECAIKYTHFIGDTPMSVRQAERMFDITLMEAHRYEDTIIPLMMGHEPEPDKACSIYKKMTTGDEGSDDFRRMLLDALQSRRKHSTEDEKTIEADESVGEAIE